MEQILVLADDLVPMGNPSGGRESSVESTNQIWEGGTLLGKFGRCSPDLRDFFWSKLNTFPEYQREVPRF